LLNLKFLLGEIAACVRINAGPETMRRNHRASLLGN
jgi:hypothetical protein